jgi:hypothetical protein
VRILVAPHLVAENALLALCVWQPLTAHPRTPPTQPLNSQENLMPTSCNEFFSFCKKRKKDLLTMQKRASKFEHGKRLSEINYVRRAF